MRINVHIRSIARWLFYLYMVAMMAFSYDTTYVKYTEYIFYLFAVFAALYCIMDTRIILCKSVLLLSTFAAMCLLSALWASHRATAFSRGIGILILVVMTILVYQLLERSDLYGFVQAIFWGGALSVVATIINRGLVQFITGMLSGMRVSGMGAGSNLYGVISSISFVCGIFIFQRQKSKFSKLITLMLLVVVLSGTLSSNSRNAFLICVEGVILLGLIHSKKENMAKRIRYLAILCLSALILYTTGLFDSVLTRLSLVAAGTDRSASSRLIMIEVGVLCFRQSPLWGIGINNAQYVNAGYFAQTYLHNNYMELLAGVGLIGFSLYYGTYVFYIYKLKKFCRKDEYGDICCILLVILIMLLTTEMSIVLYYNKFIYILFAACAVSVEKRTPKLV